MQRLLGYVIFETNIINITSKTYDTNKFYLKAVCISSIDSRTRQRLLYLAKDVLKALSYVDFDNLRKENKTVILSMLYDTDTTKAEVYCTGIIRDKLLCSNNVHLKKQLSIATDYFRKDMLKNSVNPFIKAQ